MKGDSIVVEVHHTRAAEGIVGLLLPEMQATAGRYVLTVAGESGSGKSETATAIVRTLEQSGIGSVILQQDDYFIYPPKTNDRKRREDLGWVGPGEVQLDKLDDNLRKLRGGSAGISKPLVIYAEDRITEETLDAGDAQVVITDGTYTTLLENVDRHVFIDRSWIETRSHREKRSRDQAELDEFINSVLAIEHDIISANKEKADIIITAGYDVEDCR